MTDRPESPGGEPTRPGGEPPAPQEPPPPPSPPPPAPTGPAPPPPPAPAEPPPAVAAPPGQPPGAVPPGYHQAPSGGGPAFGELAIKRSVGRVIGLSILSFGIYTYYWFYVTRKQVNGEIGSTDDPGLYTAGLLVPILNVIITY